MKKKKKIFFSPFEKPQKQGVVLDPSNQEVVRLIELTRDRQEKNLSLKKVDKNILNLVVQL